jgi:hypothetical protein
MLCQVSAESSTLDTVKTHVQQQGCDAASKDENGRKTPQLFFTFTFKYENENDKIGHENERELTEYREFRKRINSSEIMSNTVGIRKFNTEYQSTMYNN